MNDNDILTIDKGTTYICVHVSSYHPYASIVKQFTLNKLTEYVRDPRFNTVRPYKKHLRYEHHLNELYFPVNFLHPLIKFLCRYDIPVKVNQLTPIQPREIDTEINPKWVDLPHQVDSIAYLSNMGGDNLARRGLALQTGCIVGESVIRFNRGEKGFAMTIEFAYRQFNNLRSAGIRRHWRKHIATYVRSFNGQNIQLQKILDIIYSGKKPVWELTLANGKSLQGTFDHLVMTDTGYVKLGQLSTQNIMCDSPHPVKVLEEHKKLRDHFLAVPKIHPYSKQCQDPKWNCYRILRHRGIYEAKLNNMTLAEYRTALLNPAKVAKMQFVDPEKYVIHHKDGNHYNDNPDNLECMLHKDHRALHHINAERHFNQGVPTFSRCVGVKYIGIKDTYDIVCDEPNHNFTANDIVIHNSGKTYCANRAWVNLGFATMIVVPGFIEQWTKAILEQTTAGNKMYVVQGFESLGNLVTSTFQPSVIIWSLATLRNYINNDENYKLLNLPYSQFLVKYGIGTKIFDEVHLNFHALTQIDLYSNIANNIYLTATFATNNKTTKVIFDTIYPHDMRFGANEIDKYADTYFYSWTSDINERKVMTKRGYDKNKYEYQLMKKDSRFNGYMERVVIPLIRHHYLDIKRPGQKLLLFFALKVMITKVIDYLKTKLDSDLTIKPFIEKMTDDMIIDADIIVSNHSKCGTARDIKNLRTVINTVSTKAADTLVTQVFGRLRKLKGEFAEDTPIFVDTVDAAMQAQWRHYKERSGVYKSRSKTYTELKLF